MFYGKCCSNRELYYYCRALFATIAFVGLTVAESQSGCTVKSSKSMLLSSLVGDTMSSVNQVPFVWAPEYEVAVVYITYVWTESEDTGLSAVVAKNGFLNYCVRFKNRLADFTKSLQDDPEASVSVKTAVTDWYRAIDRLSRDGWMSSGVSSLQSAGTQFRTAYKHLVLNGAEIYGTAGIGEKQQREVDDFTRGIAGMMIEILKEISNQLRNVSSS